MESLLELQQISLGLIASNYNPARITPDFLIASGIIPQEWELTCQPVVAENQRAYVFWLCPVAINMVGLIDVKLSKIV